MKPEIRHLLELNGISVELTEQIIKASDSGRRLAEPIRMESLPESNDPAIINISDPAMRFSIGYSDIVEKLGKLGLASEYISAFIESCGFSAESARPPLNEATETQTSPTLDFDQAKLRELGLLLVPLTSFGVLNGGSATSYFDAKKNHALSPLLSDHFRPTIEAMSAKYASLPKGMGPAFLQKGAPAREGYSFIELKLRAWLLLIREYQEKASLLPFTLPWHGMEKRFPVFQMVSKATEKPLQEAFTSARNSPLLTRLIEQTQVDPCNPATGVQQLVAAFTLPNDSGFRDIFLSAWGKKDSPIALPGGHGQNFQVLAPLYRDMNAAGKRFAYLGNIDNLGFVPDPIGIALTFLRETEASFEFSFKTALDRKGGVLVRSPAGHLTCGDIGPAVSSDAIRDAESQNRPILFNCATGLFKLEALCEQLDTIVNTLPVRFSNQDKDAGRYSQAEQVTWEVIGLLEKPLVLGVAKQQRFLAAKFFLDCILTSGLTEKLIPETDQDKELLALGAFMYEGLQKLLSERYGLVNNGTGWRSPD